MQRRFAGIARLYGQSGAETIFAAHVAVVGVGGVGSWVVEALARSGVGSLTLIDADHVSESNINRQLPALGNTLGRAKIDVLAERVALINPNCRVNGMDCFVEQDNLAQILDKDYTWVVDCIDNFRIKAAMIAYCRRNAISIVTAGAAGGQIDPARVQVSDLYKTEQDALLAKTRRLLRQHYGFPTNPVRRFGVAAVWSAEAVKTSRVCDTQSDYSLNCAGFGACMPVTATFGMLAAAHVLKKLAVD